MTALARPNHHQSTRRLRRLLAVVLMAALLPFSSAVALTGCGDDTKASKTEIAARLALAYGSFKRFVYTPAQEGDFKKGTKGRKRAIAKAAIASAFSARMLQQAKREADKDPEFAEFSKKIAAAGASIGGIAAILQGSGFDTDQLTSGLGSLDSLVSAGNDVGIKTDINRDVTTKDLVTP